MPGDMVVALGRSTADGGALFAHSSAGPPGQSPTLVRIAGRPFAPGESVPLQGCAVPQVRQTVTLLGCQLPGEWGLDHGVNEHGVAIGRTSQRSKLSATGPCLTGTDLVRLALERARSASQAVDLITGLIERHGQGRAPRNPAAIDAAFLVTDAAEGFALEAAGQHWVLQQIHELRAASDVSLIRQDWSRISPGLAHQAIEQKWWPADGSKLDFAGALSDDPVGQASALRRWGRASLLLEQQSGHIDLAFLRRVLSDHYETLQSEIDPFGTQDGPASLCQHGTGSPAFITAASLVVALAARPERLTPIWCAFGPPCISVYFPLFLEGELPALATEAETVGSRIIRLNAQLRRQPKSLPAVSEQLSRLQARLDQEAEEFAADGAVLKLRGEAASLERLATTFMEHGLELFQNVLADVMRPETRRASVRV